MNATTSTEGDGRPTAATLLRSSWLPLLLVIGSLALAYGYEVFSFNLTIDEDSIATVGQLDRAAISLGEGRWAMAALSFVVPNPVAPLVSNGLGIALSGAAWWLLARRSFGMPPWPAALACAVGGTIPVFAFILSFSTIGFAIGIGNLLLFAFAWGIGSASWTNRILGVLAAAAAIAIYDTFLVAVAAVALGIIARRPRPLYLALGVGGSIAALILSRAIGWIVGLITGVSTSEYTSGFLDFAGALAQPVARLKSALHDVWAVVSLSPDLFGLSSIWLAVVFVLVAVVAIVVAVTGSAPLSERLIRLAAALGLLALPVVVEWVAEVVVMRSMFYFPIVVIALASIAWPGIATWRAARWRGIRVIAVALIALAVIGNATITNRLFSVAATVYALDRDLAFDIGQEKDRLLGADSTETVPVVVSGGHSWPKGVFTDTRETLGLSFFDLNPVRTATFLHAHGVLVEPATKSEIKAAQDELKTMPVYPEPGWIALENNVLILNFERESTE